MVKNNIQMLKRLHNMASQDLELDSLITLLGNFMVRNYVGIGLSCSELRFSARKDIYIEHLQWNTMREGNTL